MGKPWLATTALTAEQYTNANKSKCSIRTPALAWRLPNVSRYSSTDSRLSKLGITFPSTEVRNQEACFVYQNNFYIIGKKF